MTTTSNAAASADHNEILRNAAINRLAFYRREARRANERLQRAARDDGRRKPRARGTMETIELIAHWDGDITVLRDCIEMASDWGPFELTDAFEITSEAEGARLVACRFVYHGPEEDRAASENNLRSVLARVTRWQEPDGARSFSSIPG